MKKGTGRDWEENTFGMDGPRSFGKGRVWAGERILVIFSHLKAHAVLVREASLCFFWARQPIQFW